MSTTSELISSIISDMAKEGEEGVTAAVSNFIDLSISHYETEPWWFLETQYQFTTTDGTEYYDQPSDFGATEFSLTITVNNNTYPLIQRHYELLEDWFIKSAIFTGYPTDYANYQEQIRMYPVPNGEYTATLSYCQKLGAPSANGSNAWTTTGELLVRSRAEFLAWSLRYHDLEAAAVAKQVEDLALRDMRRNNTLRTMTGTTRKRRI